MRLLVFSDWRVQSMESLFKIFEGLEEPVDLILYAGDDIHRFVDDERNVFSELASESQQGKVLAVRGNDDFPMSDALRGDGIHDLHSDSFVHGDYVFLGVEGAVEGGPGLILYSEEEIQEHLESQYSGYKDKVPILVSHVPPYGVLDIGLRFGQRHIGSTSVRRFIDEVEPVLTLCGHCHQFGGRSEAGDFGTVVNIASHDDPGAKGRYGIVEIDGRDLEVEMTTTQAGVDHQLSRLTQIGPRRIRNLIEEGITEIEQVTEEIRDVLLSLPGAYDWHVDRWIEEARAIRNDEYILKDAEELAYLKDEDLVLLDIETDLSQDRVWLVGLYSYRDEEFTRIFEKDSEENLLHSLIDYLEERDSPTIVYYGGNYFDETCLKRRMEEHGLMRGVDLMDNSHDLGIKVQTHLLGGFKRTKLDYLAAELAKYEYEYPGMDGFLVGSMYTRYLLDGEEQDWDSLLGYNRDDVMALKATVDRIRELMPN